MNADRQHVGARPLTSAVQRIDMTDMVRAGWVVPGSVAGGMLRGSIISAQVDLTGPSQVRVSDFGAGYQRTQTIGLVATRSQVGGTRWWFVCPRTSRRARVLYRPAGTDEFASRKALGLACKSQRQSPAARAQERAKSAAAKLEAPSTGSDLSAHPPRPKGMHATTYARLLAILQAAS